MHPPVKQRARPYDATRRRAAAQRTRRAILDAATRLFVEHGYVATTVADIAAAAGVALDTVYAVVGRKPTLFRLLIESAISGTDMPVPALERDYVTAIQAETQAARKLELYTQAMRTIHVRLAPLLRVLQVAAPAEPELAAVWSEIAERRARNMRLFVADLAATGAMRQDMSPEEAADVLWATNSPEFYVLLVHERGWDPDQYAGWLADVAAAALPRSLKALDAHERSRWDHVSLAGADVRRASTPRGGLSGGTTRSTITPAWLPQAGRRALRRRALRPLRPGPRPPTYMRSC